MGVTERPSHGQERAAGENSARKATVTYDGVHNKVLLDPSAELHRVDNYKVEVATEAQDLAGNSLDQDPSNGNQKMVWRIKVRN